MECIVTIFENKFLVKTPSFFQIQFQDIERTRQMTDQEDNINLGKVVFDENNLERKTWACLGQTCTRSLVLFLSQLFVILLIIFG